MISDGFTEIRREGLRLREIARSDARNLYEWRMEASSRPMYRTTGTVTFAEHEIQIERYFGTENTDRWFMIEDAERPVGAIALLHRSADGSQYEMGRLVLDPARRGNRYGFRALALLVAYGASIGLARLTAEVFAGNERVLVCLDELGFSRVGRFEDDARSFVTFAKDVTDGDLPPPE